MKVVNNSLPEDGEVFIEEASITYYQNPDCTEDADKVGYQGITISTRDNGVANFLHIKTDGWSIDGIEDLKALINDFKKRIPIL